MQKKLRHLLDLFAMGSSVGMGLLLTNVIGMLWVSLVTGKHMPEGTASIVGAIWACKTAHGVLTARSSKEDGPIQ